MKPTDRLTSIWLVLLIYSLLSGYIVYQQATHSNAVDLNRQEERHVRMLAGDSEFFNPWQYRIFSTLVVEGFYKVTHAVVPAIRRVDAFLVFRFFQNVLIFFIANAYFKSLSIQNPALRITGIFVLAFCMSHSVFQSDLSFNTYFDILFYLLAAWLILNQHYIWVVPLVVFSALNRETSILIPAMLLVAGINWQKRQISRSVLITGIGSGIAFIILFFGIRFYYGFQPAVGINDMRGVTDYFFFNLKFFRMYPELIGTLAFLPITTILFLKRLPPILQHWFWVVCPAWFAIHLAYSTAVETRLFLVPQALLFIPAWLIVVEQWYSQQIPEKENAPMK